MMNIFFVHRKLDDKRIMCKVIERREKKYVWELIIMWQSMKLTSKSYQPTKVIIFLLLNYKKDSHMKLK